MSTRKMFDRLGRAINGDFDRLESELAEWRDAARRWMDDNDRRLAEIEPYLRVRGEQLAGAVDEAIRLSTRLVDAGVVPDPEGDTAEAQIRRLASEMARIARAAGMPDRDVYVIVAETVDNDR